MYQKITSTNLELFRKTLCIRDHAQKLLGLLITHLTICLPRWNKLMMAKIEALFKDEWFSDHSDRENYGFLALHYSMYNRYSEQVRNLYIPKCSF